MRRRLAWLLGALGLVGAVLQRRRKAPPAPVAAATDDRAEELRRRLDESRALVAEREEFEGGETTVDRAEPAAESVEERRRRVHESGRAALRDLGDGDAP